MKHIHRSLFLRLVLGFMAVMFGVWSCLMGAVIYEAMGRGVDTEQAEIDNVARQTLVVMQALRGQTGTMRHVAAQLEQSENARRVNKEGQLYRPLHLQVWQDGALIYGQALLPASLPPATGAHRLDDGEVQWMTSAQSDAAHGIAVRAAFEAPHVVLLQPSSIGYYLLPLLISFPFLLLPVWFTVRIGLRPVKSMIDDIERRPAGDLTPLQRSPYKELSLLVHAINRLMERLRERLAREQEFLADAAHELKTPLAVIQVNAEVLENARHPQRVQEARDGLRAGVGRAAHAVHQLLAFARSGADRERTVFQEIDLTELVRSRLALHAPLGLQRRVDIELHAPETCVLSLHLESTLLLIDNLIDNAIKYSPQGGRVMVDVQRQGGVTRLTISDEGPGIAPEFRDKVFERFYRLPGQDQAGSGLGLAIAERAALRNNASIRLDAGPDGRGLNATVMFCANAPADAVMTSS